MATGYALIVGVSAPGPGSGWHANTLSGVPHDVVNMQSMLRSRGFQFVDGPLKDENGTHDRVLRALRTAAERCQAGDLFVFYYSGHGAEQPGSTSAEANDQLLLTYDQAIVDNELGQIWTFFRKNVRIVVMTDSCHSGTVVREMNAKPKKRVLSIGLPAPSPATRGGATRSADFAGFNATLLHLAACRDDETAADIGSGGAYTTALLDKLTPSVTYQQLHAQVQPELSNRQVNQLGTYGDWRNFLEVQVAFEINAEWPPLSIPNI